MRFMKKFYKSLFPLFLSLILLFSVSGCSFIKDSSSKNTPHIGDSEIAAQSVNFGTIDSNERKELSVVDAVSKVERTSVAITNETGAGSGVIVDISFENGEEKYAASWKSDENIVYIITCQHMISDMGEITVYIPDEDCNYENKDYIFEGYIGNKPAAEYEREGYAVTLVGGDFESDIALLKLNLNIAADSGNKLSATKIEKAQIPSADYSVRKGETVFSIGNPTGMLPGTVSSGNVSYLERQTSVAEIGNMTLMQIAVSTNPGNSGGGLYNLYGELVGITNAGNTNYTDINFAIPCFLSDGNGFVEIAAQLGGTAKEDNYGFINGRKQKFGFSIMGNTSDGEKYVYVTEVVANGIAANAGLKTNDVINKATVYDENNEQKYTTDVYEVADVDSAIQKMETGYALELSCTRTSGFRVRTETIKMLRQDYWFCNTGK